MRFLTYLLLCYSLFQCAEAQIGTPPSDVAWLAPIVADLHLAEAMTNEIPILVRDSMREVMYDNILAEHELNRPAFDSIMWEMRREPVWLDSLYTRVGDILAKGATVGENAGAGEGGM